MVHVGEVAGGTDGDDLSAAVASAGAEVDEPVGALDEVEVVLDEDDGVAGVDEAVEDAQEVGAVLEGQAGRRLVEDVEGLACRPLG